MRPELRWALAVSSALVLGILVAEPYARLAAPYYAAVARCAARFHPWQVQSVAVQAGKSHLGSELTMHGTVRRDAEQQLPSARVVSHVQVGEVVETPLVYWTLILMWPVASMRERWLRAALALPGFLAVEALTTPAQLLGPLAQASAILAGDDDPLTVWDRWSRFLEAGGQFVFVTAAAITVTCWPRSATAPRSRVSAN